MLENLMICTLFLVSGMIILTCFKRIHMNTAYYLFLAFYCVVLLYIPFYFGGKLAQIVVGYSYNESNYLIFVYRMEKTLSAPFPFIQSISLITAYTAVFVMFGALILTIAAAFAVIRFFESISRKKVGEKSVLPNYPSEKSVILLSFREKYLEYCRLLN